MLGAWMWLAFIFIALTILFGVGDFALSAITGDMSSIEDLMQFKVMEMREFQILFIDIRVPMPNTGFFAQLAKMMTWDYNMFQGDMNIVRWIVLGPISVAFGVIVLVNIGPIFLQAAALVRQFLPRIGPIQ